MNETVKLRQLSDTELAMMLEYHRIWLVSDGQRGHRADFSLCDLGRRNLKNKHFEKSICKITRFDYSDLRGSSFDGADLECAEFQYSTLNGVKFNNAVLHFTNFHGADMDEECLATLDSADIEDAIFHLPEK